MPDVLGFEAVTDADAGRVGGKGLSLGRMAADKGAHRAIAIARKAGLPLVLAGKMREPLEFEYFETRVEPLLGDDARYVHVHPARYSPESRRVRANVLKTAVMALAVVKVHGGDPTDRALLRDLQRLVDPATRGDPMSPLLWTCKSTRHLAEAFGNGSLERACGGIRVSLC